MVSKVLMGEAIGFMFLIAFLYLQMYLNGSVPALVMFFKEANWSLLMVEAIGFMFLIDFLYLQMYLNGSVQ